jgi:hypothetical protein
LSSGVDGFVRHRGDPIQEELQPWLDLASVVVTMKQVKVKLAMALKELRKVQDGLVQDLLMAEIERENIDVILKNINSAVKGKKLYPAGHPAMAG